MLRIRGVAKRDQYTESDVCMSQSLPLMGLEVFYLELVLSYFVPPSSQLLIYPSLNCPSIHPFICSVAFFPSISLSIYRLSIVYLSLSPSIHLFIHIANIFSSLLSIFPTIH